jgi:hydroxyacylglutathione hydrolase
LDEGSVHAVDVRARSEWQAGHLPHTPNVPVGQLVHALHELPSGPLVVQCQSGARSALAASVLHRLGRRDVRNLIGGFAAWASAGLPVER